MRRNWKVVVSGGLLAIGVGACGSSDNGSGTGQSADPIKVGSLSTMSGTYAKPDASNAAKAYFDEVNKQGGVNGHTIDFKIADDQANPGQASQAARSLVDSEEVVALVGGSSSADCATNAAFYEQRKVLSLPGAGADQICFSSRNISPVNASPFVDVGLTLNYVSDTLGKRNVCLVANNASPTYVKGVQDQASAWEQRSGRKLTYTNYRLAPTDNMTTYVVQAKQAGCDALVFATGGAQLISAAKAAKAQGVDTSEDGVPYVGILVDDETAAAVGDQRNVFGMTGGFQPWNDTAIPAVKKYADLMAKAGVPLGEQSEGGYSAAEAFVEALKSIDGDIDRESVTSALRAINYQPSLMGSTYTFADVPEHSTNQSAKFLQVQNGKWTTTTKEFQTLEPGA
jgi:branched-chain amino acid transport system substrate-binding protein